MQATKQQQILGYFIEEAKEHLDTIEQGLLNLKATMADSEQLNELFRAAHSVKGGAAMLGFSSIQKVGHYLEDSFKLLKEHPVEIDQHLENLFFKGFDTLKDLVEELQSPYGLRADNAEQTVQAAEPVFTELQTYLNQRVKGSMGGATSQPVAKPAQPVRSGPELAALLNGALRKMLELFKQGDSPAGRQQLASFCSRLTQLYPGPEWRGLLQTAQGAIANPKNPYSILAPQIIKELKQSGDLLIAGRTGEIAPSRNLQQLASVAAPKPAQPTPPPSTSATIPSPQPPLREQVANSRTGQITIPAEPRAAARALLDAFNKAQLIELAEFLMKAIQ